MQGRAQAKDPARRWVALGASWAIVLMFAGLGARLVYINTALRPRLLAIAERQHQGRSVLPARRGMILDSRGRVVASSRREPDVFVDPSRAPDLDQLVVDLGSRLNLPPKQILDRLRKKPNSRYVVVASRVDDAEVEGVEDLKHPAVGFTERELRAYPLGSSMAHVIGFVGRDGSGLEGVERYYESHLRGRDGQRRTIMDARRRPLWHASEPADLPVDGGHIVLTLDAEIQRITEQALEAAIVEFDAESGVAIVMVPRSGDVLALANWPSFDANEGTQSSLDIRRNRALVDPVEPGSTFKPFVACGALDGGFITPTDMFDCEMGTCAFGSRVIKDTSPHGMMDLAGIMTFSSNIGIAKIGQRMGNGALYHTVRRFGFGEPTGIDCPGEGIGKVRPLRRWSPSLSQSATSVAMGYEVSVTPIQLLTAFCGLINGGELIRPRVVKQLLHADGSIASQPRHDEPMRRGATRKTANYVGRELLTTVVEQGTGRRAQLDRYKVMGKTGTPKLLYPGGKTYEPGAYQPVFIGAAPASDPQVAVLVMVHRPNASRGYYGGVVAAPAAAKILDWTLDYLGVPPDRTTMLTGL